MIFAESEFSLKSKWSTVNVSISSFLKLQLSRLFVTAPCFFFTLIHLLSLIEQLVLCLKWKESLNLNYKFPDRFTYTIIFLFGGLLIGDEELVWFSSQHFAFLNHLKVADMSLDLTGIKSPVATFSNFKK